MRRQYDEPFRLLVESVKDYAIIMLDPDGRITSWNAGAQRIKGYKQEEIVGKYFSRLYTPEDVASGKPEAALAQARATGRYEEHGKRRRKDGETFEAHVIITALYDENGELAGFGKVTRDVTERTEAEEERKRLITLLRHERERFQEIFTLAPAFIATLRGPDHRYEMVNPKYLELAGRSDVVGKTVREVLPEAEEAGYLALLDRVYQTGEPFTGNALPIEVIKEGDSEATLYFLNFVLQPLRDTDGTLSGIFVHGVDVSEEVRSRQDVERLASAAEQGRAKLEAVLSNMNEALFIFDSDGTLVDLNPAARKLLGYGDTEDLRTRLAPGNDTIQLRNLDGKPVPLHQRPLERVLRGEAFGNLELRVTQADTGREWIGSFSGTSTRAPGRDNSLAVITVRDVTERTLAEEERRRLLEKEQAARLAAEDAGRRLAFLAEVSSVVTESLGYHQTLDSLTRLVVGYLADWCTIALLQPGGTVERVSAAHSDPAKADLALQLKRGTSPTPDSQHALFEVLGSGKPKLYAELDDVRRSEISRDTMQQKILDEMGMESVLIVPLTTRESVIGAIFMARSDDSRRYEEADLDVAMELAHRAAVAVDNARLYRQTLEINEQLERRVAERTRELESFSYSVSHDLRAPLRGIDGFSQALLEDFGDQLDGIARDYLERVRGGARRMGELIDGLLNLSRLTRDEMQIERVDVSRIATELLDGLTRRDPHREAELDVAPGLVADGDPRLLTVLLENLLENAWKFTRGREVTRICVGSTETERGKALFVEDNGAGFNMSHVDRLFSVFQRLHRADEFEGTGIGLATVQRIVSRHGGRIWAEAEVDKGATFYFQLGRPRSQFPVSALLSYEERQQEAGSEE